jgi:hypothetical protein
VAIARGVIALVGVLDVGAALALLLVPEWFYSTFAEFPPFNRHYAGDAGAFLLGIGAGLIVAARDPRRYSALLLIGIGVSWLHAVNHLYDALEHAGTGRAGVADALLIVGVAFALTVAAVPFMRPAPTAAEDPAGTASSEPGR